MCYGCWEGAGKPAILTPATTACAELVKRVYDVNFMGGNLHAVIDDWNVEDESLGWCREYDLLDVEKACLNAMEALSVDERYSVLAITEGFIPQG